MTRYLEFFVCMAATLTAAALAQTPTDRSEAGEAAESRSPVAYVYVSESTGIAGFAAASDGKLTPLPGSPFGSGAGHISQNGKYLFALGANSIYSYAIGADGALTQVAVTGAPASDPGECNLMGYTLQIDHTGKTLYSFVEDCGNFAANDQYIRSFKIEDNGSLEFLANTDSGSANSEGELSQGVILGTDKYAYQTGCGSPTSFEVIGYKRESSGVLKPADTLSESPKTKSPADIYCTQSVLAGDTTHHLAIALSDFNVNVGNNVPPTVLASFTADSHGNLTTKSTYENMPSSEIDPILAMSISPSGKLLAVGSVGVIPGDSGFQVFHFNGGEPITHFTGLLQPEYGIQEFGWDNDNHLYALNALNGGGRLFVYTATSTGIKEIAGSPYLVPEANNIIVRSLR
jgi:hypothetical protein